MIIPIRSSFNISSYSRSFIADNCLLLSSVLQTITLMDSIRGVCRSLKKCPSFICNSAVLLAFFSSFIAVTDAQIFAEGSVESKFAWEVCILIALKSAIDKAKIDYPALTENVSVINIESELKSVIGDPFIVVGKHIAEDDLLTIGNRVSYLTGDADDALESLGLGIMSNINYPSISHNGGVAHFSNCEDLNNFIAYSAPTFAAIPTTSPADGTVVPVGVAVKSSTKIIIFICALSLLIFILIFFSISSRLKKCIFARYTCFGSNGKDIDRRRSLESLDNASENHNNGEEVMKSYIEIEELDLE